MWMDMKKKLLTFITSTTDKLCVNNALNTTKSAGINFVIFNVSRAITTISKLTHARDNGLTSQKNPLQYGNRLDSCLTMVGINKSHEGCVKSTAWRKCGENS